MSIIYCQRCGGEIPDIAEHPSARFCPQCAASRLSVNPRADKVYCQRCRGKIDDFDQHPNARICRDCRDKSLINGHKKLMIDKLPQVCRKCGAIISDIDTHPRAKLCLKCRDLKRAPYTVRCKIDYTPVVREYLGRMGWLDFIRPRYILDTDQTVREALGITEGDLTVGNKKRAMALRHLYAAINQLVGPNGEHYVRWGKTSKAYVIVRPDVASADGVTA